MCQGQMQLHIKMSIPVEYLINPGDSGQEEVNLLKG
jgi:hypothetical protein